MSYEDEFEYDIILGAYKKKSKLAILNKRKLDPFELDELMCEDEEPN